MSYDIKKWQKQQRSIVDWLNQELSGIHAGRATPSLLDSVSVKSYGSKMPLKALGTITVENAKTLRITLWDQSQIKNIESAIAAANLGISTTPSEDGVRVIFPELTSERRQAIIKLTQEKLESAKITLKKEREKAWQDIQEQTKVGAITEDEKFRLKEDLQKAVNELQTEMESAIDLKRKEIES